MYPTGVETKVRSSKAKGEAGNLMILEVLAKRLHTRKEDELGREKQNSPLEVERREKEGAVDAAGSKSEWERATLRQAPRPESYKGN